MWENLIFPQLSRDYTSMSLHLALNLGPRYISLSMCVCPQKAKDGIWRDVVRMLYASFHCPCMSLLLQSSFGSLLNSLSRRVTMDPFYFKICTKNTHTLSTEYTSTCAWCCLNTGEPTSVIIRRHQWLSLISIIRTSEVGSSITASSAQWISINSLTLVCAQLKNINALNYFCKAACQPWFGSLTLHNRLIKRL